ncbi:MAG TPA: LysM peptidoglycan-binding domain-containing protein [Planctomycetaceae bacterium]
MASAPATSPPNSPAAAPAAAPTSADWGLAPKSRPATGWKFKIASLLGLLTSVGGGYFGYQQYFPTPSATEAKDPDAVETADADTDDDADTLGDSTSRDPFDDTVKVSPDDEFDEPANREPRRTGHPPQAAPITRKVGATVASRKRGLQKPASQIDDSLDMADDADDSSPPRIAQSEPDDDDDDFTARPLERPAKTNRQTGISGNYANRGATMPGAARRPNAGPRIQSINERDPSAEDSDDLADDKLEGYDLAEPKTANRTVSRNNGPKIQPIDVRDEPDADERLEGFTTDDATSRRAVSRTRIVRSTPADRFDDDSSSLDADADLDLGRSSRSGATPIQPRGKTPSPPDARIRANRLSADELPDAGISHGANSDTYRVQPEDNFWKISRKQYGTARYYQALMRHNLDRVPDPQKLKPGTQIATPTAAFLERKYPELIEKAPAGSAPHQTVSQGSDGRPRFERPTAGRDSDGTAAPATGKAPADGYFYSKSGDPMYRIGADDTLTGIAQRHLGRASRWSEIYEQNQDILGSPDNLTLGTVIRLPSDASRLSLVPENDRRR